MKNYIKLIFLPCFIAGISSAKASNERELSKILYHKYLSNDWEKNIFHDVKMSRIEESDLSILREIRTLEDEFLKGASVCIEEEKANSILKIHKLASTLNNSFLRQYFLKDPFNRLLDQKERSESKLSSDKYFSKSFMVYLQTESFLEKIRNETHSISRNQKTDYEFDTVLFERLVSSFENIPSEALFLESLDPTLFSDLNIQSLLEKKYKKTPEYSKSYLSNHLFFMRSMKSLKMRSQNASCYILEKTWGQYENMISHLKNIEIFSKLKIYFLMHAFDFYQKILNQTIEQTSLVCDEVSDERNKKDSVLCSAPQDSSSKQESKKSVNLDLDLLKKNIENFNLPSLPLPSNLSPNLKASPEKEASNEVSEPKNQTTKRVLSNSGFRIVVNEGCRDTAPVSPVIFNEEKSLTKASAEEKQIETTQQQQVSKKSSRPRKKDLGYDLFSEDVDPSDLDLLDTVFQCLENNIVSNASHDGQKKVTGGETDSSNQKKGEESFALHGVQGKSLAELLAPPEINEDFDTESNFEGEDFAIVKSASTMTGTEKTEPVNKRKLLSALVD